MTPGTQANPSAQDFQLAAAQQQLQTWLTSRAEGHSILNYNLANKQYLDALSIGKLLGVSTDKLRPYGGESHNTVNVIGTDAIDGMVRRAVADQTVQQQPVQQQPVQTQQAQPPPDESQLPEELLPEESAAVEPSPATTTGGPSPGHTAVPPPQGSLLRKLVVGAGLIAGGAAIPPLVGAIIDGGSAEQTVPVDKDGGVVVPWNQPSGKGTVEVDVY